MLFGLSLIGMKLSLPSCLKVVTGYSEIQPTDITALFGRLHLGCRPLWMIFLYY